MASSHGVGGLGLRGTGRGGGGSGSGRVHALRSVSTGSKTKSSTSPQIAPSAPNVRGTLSKDIIGRVVERHRAEIRYCYEKKLQSNPKLEGKIVVQFTVDSSGEVTSVVVQSSTMEDKDVENCVVDEIRGWNFPAVAGGGVVKTVYPFVFSSD